MRRVLTIGAMVLGVATAHAEDRVRTLKFGASGCPEIADWKAFADQIMAGNFKANLPPSCPFLAQHTAVKGPIRQANAGGAKLDLVSVQGRLLWIETGNLK